MTTLRIAAVFASYNRKEAALECVRRLHGQTRQPDLVVVADNASTDGTPGALRALGWKRLIVIALQENLGNAGGVRAAMDRASELGADAVWVLDDDSWPRRTALEGLLQAGFDPEVVRHSLQIDPVTGRFSWPLPVRSEGGAWHTIRTLSELPVGETVPTRASWTGALFPKTAWEKAGPVLGELFIRGEDEEYPRRVAGKGFRFEAVRGSVLDHPSARNLRCWRLGGKEFWFESGLEDWKFYYEVRNTVWLKIQEGSRIGALVIALLYGAAAVIFDGWSSGRRGVWLQAVADAGAGRLGRRDFQSSP